MSSDSVPRRRELIELAADGCLITAGLFGFMMGAAFVLDWLGVSPLGEPNGSGVALVLSVFSWLLQVGSFVIGPLVAWWLHRRRFSKLAVVALIAGFPLGGALVAPIAMMGALIDWFVGLFTTTLYVGAIAYLVAVVLAFITLLVWLDVDALRDMSSARREHVRLDVARLIATAGVIAFSTGVVVVFIGGEDSLEAAVFMLLAGVQGGAVITAAAVVLRILENKIRPSAVQDV